MCCTSLRGIAFFGASLHVAVGLILFSRYVIATVVFTFYNFNNLFSEKATAFLAPFMVYVTLLLALGVLIFHSVEKECFVLLKWSSVAFSLLQLLVFVVILILKFTPNFEYHRFPFIPESLVSSISHVHPSSGNPAGPEVYLAIPHGTTLDEKDLIIKPSSKSPSSDPPDPGGTQIPGGGGGSGGYELTIPNSNTNNSSNENEGLITEIYRLTILVCCFILTLVYLIFLFLYIRQLHYEDTGHVFGHAGQAVTRNIAFYVQPQFVSAIPAQQQQQTLQGTQDNNKGQVQVQRSQTQIPQQFLPQSQQSQQSPKKMNQVQHLIHSQPPSSVDGSGSNPEVHRSPKRQGRSASQQSSLQSQMLQNQGQLQNPGQGQNPGQLQNPGQMQNPGQIQNPGHMQNPGHPHPQNLGQQPQNFSPKRNPHHPHHHPPPAHHGPHPVGGGGGIGGVCDNPAISVQQHHLHPHNPQFKQQLQPHPHPHHPPHPQPHSSSQLPILGPTPANSGPQGQINYPHHHHHHGGGGGGGGGLQPPPHPHPQSQPQPPPPPHQTMRGPIPAQVRIGFYPHDLRQDPQSQALGLGVSPQNIRPRTGSFTLGENLGEPHPQSQQQQGQVSQTLLRGPPPPPGGGGYHPQPQHQHQHHPPQPQPLPLMGHHPQMQRLQQQYQQHSATYPSDSSSSVAYSPNPPRSGKHPISMV